MQTIVQWIPLFKFSLLTYLLTLHTTNRHRQSKFTLLLSLNYINETIVERRLPFELHYSGLSRRGLFSKAIGLGLYTCTICMYIHTHPYIYIYWFLVCRYASSPGLAARQFTPAIDAAIYRPNSTSYQLQPSFHTSWTEPEPTARARRAGEEFY